MVNANVDFAVIDLIMKEALSGGSKFGFTEMFPADANKFVVEDGRRGSNRKGRDPGEGDPGEGLYVMMILGYMLCCNFSDIHGSEGTEIVPFWRLLLYGDEKWGDPLQKLGGLLYGSQVTQVCLEIVLMLERWNRLS